MRAKERQTERPPSATVHPCHPQQLALEVDTSVIPTPGGSDRSSRGLPDPFRHRLWPVQRATRQAHMRLSAGPGLLVEMVGSSMQPSQYSSTLVNNWEMLFDIE